MAKLQVLKAAQIAGLKGPRLYADGGGLYLQVTKGGSRSWLFRFMLNGKSREMGLGAYPAISLAKAREIAGECRTLRASGVDPIEYRNEKREAAKLEAARAMTFDDCATEFIETHKAGWRNAKHADQWRATLETHASKLLALPVQEIDTVLVSKVLTPIWTRIPETASRVRGRIEAILDRATALGYRKGENPARWKGHLENVFPNKAKVRGVQHHPALPYQEINAFVKLLRGQEGVAARALEFLCLTATRTNETLRARWDEINGNIWTIPGERMKAGREHRVPLPARAIEIIEEMRKTKVSEYVFPGRSLIKPLSGMSMLMLLRRMNHADITVHGFRSTFRDWCAECTHYSREVAEMALAHTIEDKVEAAYRRGDLLEKRAALMEEWASYIDKPTATVSRLRVA